MFGVYLDAVWPTLWRVGRAVLGLPPLLIVLSLCYYHWKNSRLLAAARKLSNGGYPALPLVGHFHYILHGFKGVVQLIMAAQKEIVAAGINTVCVWTGPAPIFVLHSPEDIRTVLLSPKTSEKSAEYDYLKFALGNGLLTAPGSLQKITRRHINPMFQPRNLDYLMPVFNESSRLLIRDLDKYVGFGYVDVLKPVTIISLRNVSCVVFGSEVNINIESEEFKGMLKAVHSIGRIDSHRIVKVWLRSDIIFKFLWRKEVQDIQKWWKEYSRGPLKTIRNRKNHHGHQVHHSDNSSHEKKISNGVANGVSSSVTNQVDPRALSLSDTFSILQEHYPGFSDEELQHEMITLLLTGTDSSKTAISSCLVALAACQDIQERAYEEIVSVAGEKDRDVTLKDINRMPFLDQVFRETLRKFNVFPIILRKVSEDIQLSEGNVPAGATLALSLMGIHFDPKVFPDPEKFDPDRFSPANYAKMKKFSFLPFSAGARNCIGKAYAAIFAKTVLVHVLRRYRLFTTLDINNIKYNITLALYSEEGYPLLLQPRC